VNAGPRDSSNDYAVDFTVRYDNQKLEKLQAAALKLESGKTFDPNDAKNRIDDRDEVFKFLSSSGEGPDDRRSGNRSGDRT